MSADVNVTEKVAEALRQNLRDTTGDCICDPAYTERRLVDPYCGWHEAEGTTDNDSVARVLSVLHQPDVLTGIAGVLRRTFADSTCGGHLDLAGDVADWMPEAAAVVEWLRGRAL